MIKEKNVLISINSRNISFYKNLGYDIDVPFNKKIDLLVSIDHTSKNSKIKITAICQICEKEVILSLLKYWKNFERGGFYSCFGCKNVKKEITTLKTYGCKSFSQTDEFKMKYKKTCLEKYGVENPNMLSEFREKTKETCIAKYGVSTALVLPENIENARIWMSSDEFKMKSRYSIMEKYNVEHFSKTDEFKKIISDKKDQILEKIKETFLKNWGNEYYSKTYDWKIKYLNKIDETREKIKQTCLDRYGVENVSQISEVYDKIIRTKIENNIIISSSELDDWDVYKREVRKITNRNKKILFEKWEGTDYYDNEKIIGYFSYSHTHRFYPTIDHKISVLYGFKNNISTDLIGSIDNLCITKRYINSIKGKLIESEFNILS
jgi:hypothetical protein